MKILTILSILFCSSVSSNCQQPFILSLEQPEVDCISDVTQVGNKFYFIQNRAFNLMPPYDFDNYCDLIITGNDGSIIEIYNFKELRTYQRVLKVIDDDVYLIGFIKSDSCKTKLVISKFNILTHSLVDLSSRDFCDNTMLKIKIVEGLYGETFIEEYHSEGMGIRKLVFQIDTSYALIPEPLVFSFSDNFSVDFSRTGYLIADSKLYNFYDADFNYRKQIIRDYVFYIDETHLPFRQNLILVATVQTRTGLPDPGIQIRLIDSLLNVKKQIVIFPMHHFSGNIYLPFYGSLDIKNKNEIWAAGDFEQLITPLDSGFYYIAKLDSNLNIICEHFLGYDTWYRTYGIKAFDSGGAIVYGSRLREGHLINEGEDIFAIRVGENCELPTIVSTHGVQEPLLSISAYPNPGINDLTFSVNGFDPVTLRVEMIDPLGRVLFTTKDLTNSITVPELPAGQYFYRILQKERLLGVGSWVKQ